MLLLSHEFETLKKIEASGSLPAANLEPMTAKVLCGHRLARRLGDQVTVTLLGQQVLKNGVVKPGPVRDYVHFMQAPEGCPA
jgi:hypothetical protein